MLQRHSRPIRLLAAAGALLAAAAVAPLADLLAPSPTASSAPHQRRSPPTPTPEPTPAATVRAAAAAFVSALAAAQATPPGDPDALRAALAPMLVHLDLPRITRLLLGRHWRGLGKTERRAAQRALVAYLIRHHGPGLRQVRDLRLEVLAAEPAGPADDSARLPVILSARGLPRLRVHLHLSRGEQGWRIYDATLSGVGLIGLQRPLFTGLADARGVDGLMAALAR